MTSPHLNLCRQDAAARSHGLQDEERQPCEVWTRVMGYHRPVTSFNVGKQGEHEERRFFIEPAKSRVLP